MRYIIKEGRSVTRLITRFSLLVAGLHTSRNAGQECRLSKLFFSTSRGMLIDIALSIPSMTMDMKRMDMRSLVLKSAFREANKIQMAGILEPYSQVNFNIKNRHDMGVFGHNQT
jgi:hypothetical protein